MDMEPSPGMLFLVQEEKHPKDSRHRFLHCCRCHCTTCLGAQAPAQHMRYRKRVRRSEAALEMQWTGFVRMHPR